MVELPTNPVDNSTTDNAANSKQDGWMVGQMRVGLTWRLATQSTIPQMAQQTALPPTLPPRLINREAAAAYISVSPTKFDEMIAAGKMPRPKFLGGRRKAWDVRALDAAVDNLEIDGIQSADETWNDINAA